MTWATLDLTGQTIGSYQIQEKIGQGGMAEIYKAYHAGLDRHAAVKVLQPSLTDSSELIARFQREAQVVASLRHPHIVQVYDSGFLDTNACSYLIMEYVAGRSLQDEMNRREAAGEPWTADEILRIVDQVAGALDYAHKRGIIHRDVKPGNVLLDTNRDAILTDFGLSALRRGRSTLISTLGQPFGTPEYVAPEQAMDYKAAVTQSDQYSLGCVVYELITGHLLFEADTPLSIALMHITQDPFPPSYYVPDLPRAVERVILKALAKEPELRFSTAGAMAEALRRAWTDASAPISSRGVAEWTPARPEDTPTGPSGTPTPALPAGPEPAEPPTTQPPPAIHPAAPAEPPTTQLSNAEARLVLWAADNASGFLNRPAVCQQLGLATEWQARRILESWTANGWLIRATSRKLGYQVTDELIRLAREHVTRNPAGADRAEL